MLRALRALSVRASITGPAAGAAGEGEAFGRGFPCAETGTAGRIDAATSAARRDPCLIRRGYVLAAVVVNDTDRSCREQ
jgi:hypothetical protein